MQKGYLDMSFRVKRVLSALKPTKKKVLIAVAVLAVLVVGFMVWNKNRAKPASSSGVDENATRTVMLHKSALNESVTVTGTVKSGDTANVTTALTYPVKEILVQVGDRVQEGDVIATLDSEDLEKEIAKKQKSAGNDAATAQTNYDNAASSFATAQTNYSNANAALESARNAFLPAYNSVSAAQSVYDQALTAWQNAGMAVNNATAAHGSASAAVASAQSQLDAANAAGDAAAASAAQQALDAANASLAAAQGQLDAANADQAAKQAALTAAETELNNQKQRVNYTALEQAYTQADSSCTQAKNTYDQAKMSLDNAKNQLENSTSADTLEELQEKLADCTITATASGTVTAIGATVGSLANQLTIATIQDTDALKVAVTIDEDDIKKVSVGQRAIIKSDATGDAEIAGTVSQLSLTASAGQSANGQSSTSGFGAEITVDGADSGLLVGLSAKVEIILSEAGEVYSVPYDAVEQDADGNDVIYVKDGSDWKAVPVTKGLETDYYVEISGEGLADGMEVRVPIGSSGGADDPFANMMNGMGGGNVVVTAEPSGGMAMADPAGGNGGPRGG